MELRMVKPMERRSNLYDASAPGFTYLSFFHVFYQSHFVYLIFNYRSLISHGMLSRFDDSEQKVRVFLLLLNSSVRNIHLSFNHANPMYIITGPKISERNLGLQFLTSNLSFSLRPTSTATSAIASST